MGIGRNVFVVFKHKVDCAFKISTRLLLIRIAREWQVSSEQWLGHGRNHDRYQISLR